MQIPVDKKKYSILPDTNQACVLMFPAGKLAIIISYLSIFLVIIISFIILQSNAHAENFYQWVDKDGVSHMSNYPVDSQQERDEVKITQSDEVTDSLSDTSKFMAKSKEWLKPGIKDLGTTIEISHAQSNIYDVNILSRFDVKPFSAVEPDDVLFFSFCVADYFASKKGFNGWEMLKDNEKEIKESRARKGIKYSIGLAKISPQTSTYKRDNCARFIRPEFLSEPDRVYEISINKPMLDVNKKYAATINNDCKNAYTATVAYLFDHSFITDDKSALDEGGYRASPGITTNIAYTNSKNFKITCTGDAAWSLSKNTAEMIMTNGTMTMKQASP